MLESLQAGFDDCPSITLDIVRTFCDAGPSTIRCLLDNLRQTHEQLLQMAPAGRAFFLDLRATLLLREHAFFDSKDVGRESHGEAQELNEVDPKRRRSGISEQVAHGRAVYRARRPIEMVEHAKRSDANAIIAHTATKIRRDVTRVAISHRSMLDYVTLKSHRRSSHGAPTSKSE